MTARGSRFRRILRGRAGVVILVGVGDVADQERNLSGPEITPCQAIVRSVVTYGEPITGTRVVANVAARIVAWMRKAVPMSSRRSNDDTPLEVEPSTAGATSADDLEEWDWSEICDHEYDEECDWYGCHHTHCFNFGECGCAGYCDDYQTYNLRPAETGGEE